MLNNALHQCSKSFSATTRAMAPVVKRFAELGVMIFGCYLTLKGLDWSTDYADRALGLKEATETGVALVIGAVLAPLLAFTGAIVKMYLTHGGNGNGHSNEPPAPKV